MLRPTEWRRKEMADRCMKWAGPLCVLFVWSFCAVAYWAVWHYVFIPYMMYTGQEPVHIIVLVVFHALVVLCLYSYYCAIVSDPGYVRPGYVCAQIAAVGGLLGCAMTHAPAVTSRDGRRTIAGGGTTGARSA